MSAEFSQLLANLGIASIMVTITVMISFWGFLGLSRVIAGSHAHIRPHEGRARAAVVIVMIVFGIFALHTVQIWLYAALYLLLGEMHSIERALYFSTVTFASLGYGDIVLSPQWRVLSGIEAANGVILFAWSTAFLLTATARLKLLDHAWLEDRSD